MKKVIFLFYLFLHMVLFSLAQQTERKLSAQVLLGASFPVGEFASKAANGLYVDDYPKVSG